MSRFAHAAPRSDLIASYAYGTGAPPYWALISQADRDKAASSGAAMADGRFPILRCTGDASVDSAVGLARTNAERKHTITRADSLGCASKIPDSWNADGSHKTGARATGYGVAPPPPPAAAADPAQADSAVTDAIAELKAALDKALAAQKADPDASDPKDEKVQAGLDAISQAVDQLTSDQAADAATDPAPAKPAPPKAPPAAAKPAPPAKPPVTAAAPPPPPAKGTAPVPPATNPVDPASGDIDSKAVCANPDCGHLASSHLNDDANGMNTGACQMTNCECLGMQVESQPNTGTGDDGGQNVGGNAGAQPGPASQELAHAPGNAVPDAPAPPGPASTNTEPSDLNAPPQVPGGENMGPAFTIPVAIIEGQPTGDGRQIEPGALDWRIPPVPLMGLATETHDPEGFDQNDPAVICGRIDSFERAPGEGSTQVIVAKGFYLANDDGQYWADLNEQMGRLGISADVAVAQTDIQVIESDADGFPIEMSEILTRGTIMGLTVCPYPAFEGAYIVLGDGTEKPAAQAIAQRSEGPATPANPPAQVTAGGQLVHLMAYEACEPCQQGLQVITASGTGPTRPPRDWFSNPNFTEGDGRLVEILDRRGKRAMGGKFACPLTITDEGRVYGHLAPWGVCHIGKPGCVTAPHSASDYAYFKRGQHVICAEGEKIRVGALTVNAPHANARSDPGSAMAHYDNIASCAADVNCGEDDYGIWIAGAIRPTASEEQIAALRASSISGDWRGLGGSLELVAALAVPVPGFPHAVVAGAQEEALVAAGAEVMHRLKHPVAPAEPESGDVALRHALAPLLKTARTAARERLSALRS
ncbi:MAG: hypothetical protein ACLPZR_06510 [Solirubrobacteraceae bacterium]